MLPEMVDGLLPPGIHSATWEEFMERFASSAYRQALAAGLRAAALALRAAGGTTLYVDGSFVTAEEFPSDYDGCWMTDGVDPTGLDPVLLNFDAERATQKAKYLGELFPAEGIERGSGRTFLDFFQIDKETGQPKGIVMLRLDELT